MMNDVNRGVFLLTVLFVGTILTGSASAAGGHAPAPTPPPPATNMTIDITFAERTFSEQHAKSGTYDAILMSVIGFNTTTHKINVVPYDSSGTLGRPFGLEVYATFFIQVKIKGHVLNTTQITHDIKAALGNTTSEAYAVGMRAVREITVSKTVPTSTATLSTGWYALIALTVIVFTIIGVINSRKRAAGQDARRDALNDDDDDSRRKELQSHLLQLHRDDDMDVVVSMEKLLRQKEGIEEEQYQQQQYVSATERGTLGAAFEIPPPPQGPCEDEVVSPPPQQQEQDSKTKAKPTDLGSWLGQDRDFILPPRLHRRVTDIRNEVAAQNSVVPIDGGTAAGHRSTSEYYDAETGELRVPLQAPIQEFDSFLKHTPTLALPRRRGGLKRSGSSSMGNLSTNNNNNNNNHDSDDGDDDLIQNGNNKNKNGTRFVVE
eukprot:PhM_4_TR5258/c0_g1_i1/m.94672